MGAAQKRQNEKKPHTAGKKAVQSKVEKKKAKHENLLNKLQNNKKKAILDLSVLAEPLTAVEKADLKKQVPNPPRSTKGKKRQLEREKARFQRVIQDPIYQANPMGAVLGYLEYTKTNKK